MERKQITFDTFVRGFLSVLVVVGIVMLLNRLSSVLVPFFLAWLLSYLLFPMVKFFQYRCRLKYRIAAILLSFIVAGGVATGVFGLMIPPINENTNMKMRMARPAIAVLFLMNRLMTSCPGESTFTRRSSLRVYSGSC